MGTFKFKELSKISSIVQVEKRDGIDFYGKTSTDLLSEIIKNKRQGDTLFSSGLPRFEQDFMRKVAAEYTVRL